MKLLVNEEKNVKLEDISKYSTGYLVAFKLNDINDWGLITRTDGDWSFVRPSVDSDVTAIEGDDIGDWDTLHNTVKSLSAEGYSFEYFDTLSELAQFFIERKLV